MMMMMMMMMSFERVFPSEAFQLMGVCYDTTLVWKVATSASLLESPACSSGPGGSPWLPAADALWLWCKTQLQYSTCRSFSNLWS